MHSDREKDKLYERPPCSHVQVVRQEVENHKEVDYSERAPHNFHPICSLLAHYGAILPLARNASAVTGI